MAKKSSGEMCGFKNVGRANSDSSEGKQSLKQAMNIAKRAHRQKTG